MGTGRAPGKAILAGEHFVLHGTAALAVPVRGRCVEVTVDHAAGSWDVPTTIRDHLTALVVALDLEPEQITCRVETTLPVGAGLGGSAALAVALVRAVHPHLTSEPAVRSLAHELEKIAHGTPSGIDDAVATYGCPVFLSPVGRPEPLTLANQPTVWVGVTSDRTATQDAIERVRQVAQRDPAAFAIAVAAAGRVVARSHAALVGGDWTRLGVAMNEAHELLQAVDVSTPALDALVDAARGAGALGAKLTGGGLGGAVVALARPDNDLGPAFADAGATDVIGP